MCIQCTASAKTERQRTHNEGQKRKAPTLQKGRVSAKNTFNEYNIFEKALIFALNGCIIKTVKDHTQTHGGNNYEKAHC
nr:MAG TPA: hypothetical protein [Caudoviricetes sp.]